MEILHMNKGVGENSYAKNSIVQRKIISLADQMVEEAILGILCTNIPEYLGIADLGCSTGPNTLSVISHIIDTIHVHCYKRSRPSPELNVALNDLPTNDFNNIFESLPELHKKLKLEKGPAFGPCFISGVPGSFYGRLFPRKSLHFVHSSSSLHWLSQIPPGLDNKMIGPPLNKGKIYLSKTSPKYVYEAYAVQFKRDFSLFLESRAEELVAGGRMVLSLMSRSSNDPFSASAHLWELLAEALMSMASQGLLEEELVDTFNATYYAPSIEELIWEIQKEGSFIVDRINDFETEWDYGIEDYDSNMFESTLRGQRVAKMMRAVIEPMISSHFGAHMMDDLFMRFARIAEDHLSKHGTKNILVVISMTRKA